MVDTITTAELRDMTLGLIPTRIVSWWAKERPTKPAPPLVPVEPGLWSRQAVEQLLAKVPRHEGPISRGITGTPNQHRKMAGLLEDAYYGAETASDYWGNDPYLIARAPNRQAHQRDRFKDFTANSAKLELMKMKGVGFNFNTMNWDGKLYRNPVALFALFDGDTATLTARPPADFQSPFAAMPPRTKHGRGRFMLYPAVHVMQARGITCVLDPNSMYHDHMAVFLTEGFTQ